MPILTDLRMHQFNFRKDRHWSGNLDLDISRTKKQIG